MNYIKKGAIWLLIGSIIWTMVELYQLYEIYKWVNKFNYFGDRDRSPLYLQFFKTLMPICTLVFAAYASKHEDSQPISSIADTGDRDVMV